MINIIDSLGEWLVAILVVAFLLPAILTLSLPKSHSLMAWIATLITAIMAVVGTWNAQKILRISEQCQTIPLRLTPGARNCIQVHAFTETSGLELLLVGKHGQDVLQLLPEGVTLKEFRWALSGKGQFQSAELFTSPERGSIDRNGVVLFIVDGLKDRQSLEVGYEALPKSGVFLESVFIRARPDGTFIKIFNLKGTVQRTIWGALLAWCLLWLGLLTYRRWRPPTFPSEKIAIEQVPSTKA